MIFLNGFAKIFVEISVSETSLSFEFKRIIDNLIRMSSSQVSPKEKGVKSRNETSNYLEKKYGKEPTISTEELNRMRWKWH